MKRNPVWTAWRAVFCITAAVSLIGRSWGNRPAAQFGAASPIQANQRLLIKISGIRNDRGEMQIALFQGPRGFPNSETDAVAHQSIRIAPGGTTTIVTFADLKPGQYAVALFHDENDNGTLDTSLGFPLEGFGTSNNPPLHWRAPSFNESRFELNHEHREMTITIQMHYLTENSPD